jgi:hypothetical protein
VLLNEQRMKKVLERLALEVKLQDSKLKYEIHSSFVSNELSKLKEGFSSVSTHLTY